MVKYIIFLATFISGCSGCKDPNCPEFLIFELPSNISPNQDTLMIGDTLVIECSFNAKMTDISGSVTSIFDNFDFQLRSTIFRIDSLPTDQNCLTDFGFSTNKGLIKTWETSNRENGFYLISPEYLNPVYQFSFSLVLKKKGTFMLAVGPAEDERLSPFTLKDICTHSNIDFVCNVNQRVGNHFEMIANCPDEFIRRYYTLEEFNRNGGYCFIVK